MKRMISRKSHSWWWDSHISPKNSRWLSENLEQMDRLVKEMLKLIEEEGDSFAKKAEMYYRRRPELVAHVEDFYRMYRALAERYDIVTGELRKNIPSDLQSQGSGNSSDFGTEPASPSFSLSPDLTPEHKQRLPKPVRKAAGFDAFHGSAASFEFSQKGSDDSSSSSQSESDSESEDGKVVGVYEKNSELNSRIIQLEDELREAREKIMEYEKGSNGPCVHSLSSDEHRNIVSEAETANLKSEILFLKEAMEIAAKQFETEIQEYKMQIDAITSKFMGEKTSLEVELRNSISDLKLEAEKFAEEKSCLEIRILVQGQMINQLKVMSSKSSEMLLHEKSALESKIYSLMNSEIIHVSRIQALEDHVRELEAEKNESDNASAKRIAGLNRSLDAYKLQIDTLTSEKDELNARVSKLMDDAQCRDENCRSMADHLHQLHIEQVKLIKEIEEARKKSAELMSRLRELEEEVERQRDLILDGAEGKREAIRQLCFSMEHYRDGYQKLRQMLEGGHSKRLLVVAT